MSDDKDDGVEIPEEPDFEASADVFGEELWTETRDLCERAHKLLGDEVVGGIGAAETDRVCLDIPKGLLLIAQYVVAHEQFNQSWDWMEDAMADKGTEGRTVHKAVHERLTKYLKDALHEELHWLATGSHLILREEAVRRGWRREKP
jgi:hypothetical protein